MAEILRYGLKWESSGWSDLQIESYCFINRRPFEKGGMGATGHFLNYSRMMFPDMIDHEWSERQIASLTDDRGVNVSGNVRRRFVTWMGCMTSGKTFQSARFAFLWWQASPCDSIVILCSTEKDMIRRRVWPVIQDLYHGARRNIARQMKIKEDDIILGHLVDSKTTLQAKKGDDKHAIFAMAVKGGETARAVANLQGQHAPRILLVIDEATDTPEAIFKTIPNLAGACSDFTVVFTGNPLSRTLDPMGQIAEPEHGWGSVTKETSEWRTKPNRSFCTESGWCIRFQGSKSPNVRAGKTVIPFIYTWEDHQYAIKNRDQASIEYWKWDEGFPPPDGVCNTVFSEVMVDKYGGRGQLIFLSKMYTVGSLDPAFGGDRCIAKFADVGMMAGGKIGVQLTDTVEILPLADSKDEVDYQVARQFIQLCKDKRITPDHAGTDATGTGRGVYAILSAEWSPEVKRVEFGGAPSDMPAGIEDVRPSHEVYDRRVTELWYSCKNFLLGGQLGGLVQNEVREFCAREYTYKNRKVSIDTKDECKKKIGISPDHADAVAVLIEVCRISGAVPGGHTNETQAVESEKQAAEADEVYADPVSDDWGEMVEA